MANLKDSIEQLENLIDKAADIAGEDAAILKTKKRNALPDNSFAVPGKRKLPIHDCNHARNAAARLNQTQGLTPEEKRIAKQRIQRKLAQCRGEK